MFDESERPDLAAIERQLAAFVPAPLQVDRDRLMFAAGRAAARPEWLGYIAGPSWAGGRWLWPTATAMMTAATILLGAILLLQQQPPPIAHQADHPQPLVEQVPVEAPRPAPPPPLVAMPTRTPELGTGYLGLRNAALSRGIGGIEIGQLSTNGRTPPASDAPLPQPATARELLQEFLPEAGSPSAIRS